MTSRIGNPKLILLAMLSLVLVSASPGEGEAVHHLLAAAGFAVLPHALGSTPGVEFPTVAVALVEVGSRPDAAALQTRRWRAELGDEHLPIVWLLPGPDAGLAARGLDAGADAVLARPLEADALLAQIRAAVRTRTTVARVAARAAEARLLGEQLRHAHTRLAREQAAARRVQQALLPRSFPELGEIRFAVAHRSRARPGSDFHDVRRLGADCVGFFVGDSVEAGGVGTLVGVFAALTATRVEGEKIVPPNAVLAAVNRELLAFEIEDRPLVALLAGTVNGETGDIRLARAGLPAPVSVPVQGEPATWTVPGPFLGVAEASYPVHTAVLRPGEKLLIGTDGTRPDGDPGPGSEQALLEAATRHRTLSGQSFVDAVARDLLQRTQHTDDFTLLLVERTGSCVSPLP